MSFKFDLKKILTHSAALLLIFQFLIPYSVIAQESVAESEELDPALYDEDGMLLDQPFRNENITYPDDESQPDVGVQKISMDPSFALAGEPVSCFDYYAFGSIDLNLVTDQDSYVAGDIVTIKGSVQNNNKYPMVGLDIKARIIKDIPNPDPIRSEMIVVDEFVIAENISIDAEKGHDVLATHLLPFNAPSGNYQVLLYAVEQDRFNMAGLYFTNDIIASKLSFRVEGKTQDHVYLDQTQITVGDMPHNVMAFMTRHNPGMPVTVEIPLNNPSDEDIQMSVTYDLFSWDSSNPANRLKSRTEEVLVPANSAVQLSYEVEQTPLPVYYLSITAEPAIQDEDPSVFRQKTKSNIRFTIAQNSKPRVNFTGVDHYPLKRGEETTLVTCFHNTDYSINPNSTRIETVIYDQDNKELARTEYFGKTNGNIEAIAQKFKPSRDVISFSVVSTLYDADGSVIDKIEKKYDCANINSDYCPSGRPSLLVIGVSVATIIGLGVLIYKRKTLNTLRV